MTAEIVNLRKIRKKQERAAKETLAAANRAAFGRTKSEKQQTSALSRLEQKRHSFGVLVAPDPPSSEDEGR